MDDFDKAVNKMLEQVSHFYEEFWPQADVDLLEDSLTVNLQGEIQYLFNKHSITQQIWVSSPFTGAHHFKQRQGIWVNTRSGEPLEHFLQNEKDAHAS